LGQRASGVWSLGFPSDIGLHRCAPPRICRLGRFPQFSRPPQGRSAHNRRTTILSLTVGAACCRFSFHSPPRHSPPPHFPDHPRVLKAYIQFTLFPSASTTFGGHCFGIGTILDSCGLRPSFDISACRLKLFFCSAVAFSNPGPFSKRPPQAARLFARGTTTTQLSYCSPPKFILLTAVFFVFTPDI